MKSGIAFSRELIPENSEVLFEDEYIRLYEKVYRGVNNINDVIAKFNNFIDNVLPKIFNGFYFETADGGIATITNIMISKPTIPTPGKNDSVEPMFPIHAIIGDMTYSVNVMGYVTEYDKDDYLASPPGKILNIKSQTATPILVVKIPIIVGCKYCNTYGIPNYAIAEKGENEYSQGGYMIINGTRYTIQSTEMLRHNVAFIFSRKANKGGASCSMTHDTRESSNVTNIAREEVPYGSPIIVCTVAGVSRTTDGAKKNNPGVNVISLIKTMGKVAEYREDDSECPGTTDEIIERIKSFTNPTNWDKVYAALSTTLLDEMSIEDPVAYIAERVISIMPNPPDLEDQDDETLNHIYYTSLNDYFDNYIIPMRGLEMSVRIDTLITMIIYYAEYLAELRPVTNRDIFEVKRLSDPARTIAMLLGSTLRQIKTIVNFGSTKVDRTQRVAKVFANVDDLATAIMNTSTKASEIMTRNFTNSSWGGSNSGKPLSHALKDFNMVQEHGQISRCGPANNTRSTQPDIRSIKNSQIGYNCYVFTPTSDACGVTKERSIPCVVSHNVSPDEIVMAISKHVKRNMSSSKRTMLVVNGRSYGWCDGEKLSKFLVNVRRNPGSTDKLKVDKHTSIFLDGDKLTISSDEGRMLRPLLILDENEVPIIEQKNWWDKDFSMLLHSGAIEFLDTTEITAYRVAFTRDDIRERSNDMRICRRAIADLPKIIEKLRLNIESGKLSKKDLSSNTNELEYTIKQFAYYKNELEILENNKFTHMEIHPSVVLGISASVIPLIEKNQFSKSVGQSNMGRQAMTLKNYGQFLQFPTSVIKNLVRATAPLMCTATERWLHLRYGNTCYVQFAAFTGDSVEDASVINEDSLDKFALMTTTTIVVKVGANIGSKGFDPVQLDVEMPNISELNESERARFRFLDPETGLPYINSPVRVNDYVLGITRKHKSTFKVENASRQVGEGEEGIVTGFRQTLVTKNNSSYTEISILIVNARAPMKGDKYDFRNGQKITIGGIMPSSQIPVNDNGEKPDIIINPHCVKRMTVAFFDEPMITLASLLSGRKIDTTPFSWTKEKMDKCYQIIEKAGYDRDRYTTFTYDGSEVDMRLYSGAVYVMSLRYFGNDQNVQGKGRLHPVTRQAADGVKYARNERVDVMSGHQAPDLDRNIGMESSDIMYAPLCLKCGYLNSTKLDLNNSTCDLCDASTENLKRVEIPYSTLLFDDLLTTLGMRLNCSTVQTKSDRTVEERVKDLEELEQEDGTDDEDYDIVESDGENDDDDEDINFGEIVVDDTIQADYFG